MVNLILKRSLNNLSELQSNFRIWWGTFISQIAEGLRCGGYQAAVIIKIIFLLIIDRKAQLIGNMCYTCNKRG